MYNINFISLNPVIGGQEIYLINIIKQLKDDYHIVVYTKLSVWKDTELINIDGITLHDIEHIAYNRFFTIKKIILSQSSKSDIFIFNGNRAIYLGAMFFGRYKKIAIQHSSLYDQQDGYLKRLLRTAFYKIVLSKYKKLIGISKHSIEPLWGHKKVEIILNGVDTDKFFQAPKPEKLIKKYALNDQDKVILMIGILNDNKGQYEALEILKYLGASYKMILVGSGEDTEKIKQYILKHHLQNRVFMTGKISRVSDYYHLADILLFMSKHEGLPLTIIEAMACGVPVVTTNVGGINEIIKNEETGIFISRSDKKKVSLKIETVMKNTILTEKLIINSHKLVKKELNWKFHTSCLKEIIKRISL